MKGEAKGKASLMIAAYAPKGASAGDEGGSSEKEDADYDVKLDAAMGAWKAASDKGDTKAMAKAFKRAISFCS